MINRDLFIIDKRSYELCVTQAWILNSGSLVRQANTFLILDTCDSLIRYNNVCFYTSRVIKKAKAKFSYAVTALLISGFVFAI